MTARQNLVKTTEPVPTWSTTINVAVLQDLMEQIVKTVSAMIAQTLSVCGNEKKRILMYPQVFDYYIMILMTIEDACVLYMRHVRSKQFVFPFE